MPIPFLTPWLYRIVRFPIMLGFALMRKALVLCIAGRLTKWSSRHVSEIGRVSGCCNRFGGTTECLKYSWADVARPYRNGRFRKRVPENAALWNTNRTDLLNIGRVDCRSTRHTSTGPAFGRIGRTNRWRRSRTSSPESPRWVSITPRSPEVEWNRTIELAAKELARATELIFVVQRRHASQQGLPCGQEVNFSP